MVPSLAALERAKVLAARQAHVEAPVENPVLVQRVAVGHGRAAPSRGPPGTHERPSRRPARLPRCVGTSDGVPAPAGPARPWLDVPRDATLAGADAGAARAAAVRGRFGPAAPDEPAAASSSSLGVRHAVLAEEVGGRGCWLACRPRRRFGLRDPVPRVVATTWGRGISAVAGRSPKCFFGRGGAAAAAAPRALPELL